MDLKRKEQYESIRKLVMNDTTLKDNPSRLVSFMDKYKDRIKNEPAVIEWEANLWERDIREIFLFIFSCLFFFTISGYLFSDNKETQEVIRNLGIFLICMQSFFIAMSLSPERYYHKITSTGIYIYSYKRGKAYREKLIKGFLIVGAIAAVVLLFILGPMAFAGAGAGTLGLLSLAAMAKDKPPKEFALPWEAIFAVGIDEHNGLFRKKKIFSAQFHIKLVCERYICSEVQRILDQYKVNGVLYVKPGRKNRQTDEFKKLKENSTKEIDFIWAYHPRNRPGE